jgi:periplasmic nitrate reductase NapD
MRATQPSRRAVLSGTLTTTPIAGGYISSAIVSVVPSRREEISDRLSGLLGVEVHHAEAFKIVIVLEADDVGAIGSLLAEIANWRGVLSANMVFEQAESAGELT